MPKYRVGLIQTVVEESTVFIDAPDREEAERLALAKANEGEVEWEFLEAPDPVRVVTVDPV